MFHEKSMLFSLLPSFNTSGSIHQKPGLYQAPGGATLRSCGEDLIGELVRCEFFDPFG